MQLPETIPLGEAAERYKCSKRTLRRKIKEKRFTALMPGRELLVVVESADKWYLNTAERAISACRPKGER